MLKKTSDIVIDTKEAQMFLCSICKTTVKSEDFNHINHICKKCDEGPRNERSKITNP